MKNLFYKLCRWYRGYIDIQNRVNGKEEIASTIIIHPQSIIKRVILFAHDFWLNHWKWSINIFLIAIGTFATIGIFIIMFLKYWKNMD